jgi:hypothetical protein
MRKALFYVGNVLGVIGTLLLIGSVAAWQLGPEMLSSLYERARPLLPFLLVGLGLVVLGILLTKGIATVPDAAPREKIRCGKCKALNDVHAKFCNQCGSAV